MLRKFNTRYRFSGGPGKPAITTTGPAIWADSIEEAQEIAGHIQPIGGVPGGLSVTDEAQREGDVAQAGLDRVAARAAKVTA